MLFLLVMSEGYQEREENSSDSGFSVLKRMNEVHERTSSPLEVRSY